MESVTSSPDLEVLESEAEPDGSATVTEMILPPFMIIQLIVIGLFALSCASQKYFWKQLCSSKAAKAAGASSASSPTIPATSDENVSVFNFLTSAEQLVIEDFRCFFNQPSYLIKLALPALLSLAFCPVTLFVYQPMVEMFWPPDQYPVPPKVNDVIACFLTPAGLVYAIAFGFAFQEAQSKQQLVLQHLGNQLMLLEQVSMLSLIAPQLQPTHKLSMLNTLKQYTLTTMKDIMGCKRSEANKMMQDGVCSGLKMITQVQADAGDVGLLTKISDLLLQLDAVSTQRLDQINSPMHVVQWLFLELLGFFSFFGVLLLRADSYRLELTMCVLTVFSISAFCYILADLDNPFHGAFRVNSTGLISTLDNLEQVQEQLNRQVKGQLKGEMKIQHHDEEHVNIPSELANQQSTRSSSVTSHR